MCIYVYIHIYICIYIYIERERERYIEKSIEKSVFSDPEVRRMGREPEKRLPHSFVNTLLGDEPTICFYLAV